MTTLNKQKTIEKVPNEIMPSVLRDWLEDGLPVKVIDIRPEPDYREWHIAGSENVVAYDELHSGNPGALLDFQSQEDTTIVTVCFAGITSRAAANYLRSKGIKAVSLIGGMQRWSLAWNSAHVPLQHTDAKVIQVRRTGKGCLSYLIFSAGEAAVIDPSVDPQIYIDLAKENNSEIGLVIDTHVHADHLTRGRILAQETGARYMLPEQDRVSFEYDPIRDKDTIDIGEANLLAHHTPGHTFESMSFLLNDEALFTGDTLFVSSIGRPDLKATPEETEQRARLLYHTLIKLTGFPDGTLVLPTHTSHPVDFDGIPISATIDEIKNNLDVINQPEDEFVSNILERIPQTPPNHLQIVRLNEAGAFPQGDITSLEAGANRCAI